MNSPQPDRSDATPAATGRRSLLDRLRDAGNVERLALALYSNGKHESGGSRLHVGDVGGGAGRSLAIQLTGNTAGLWRDSATGDGGDLVALACGVWGVPPERIGAELERGGFIPPQLGRRSPARSGSEVDESLLPPADAPPPALRIRKGGYVDPSDRWRYELGDGRPAFWVLRYDLSDGGKTIRPARWGRLRDGSRGWEAKALPAPRPLYRLPALLARPDAPVLVVEGEKTAERAAALFPDLAVTTSAGGASSAAQTGWGDVRGRDVLLLPDADLPNPKALDRALDGERYAAEVARLALAAGAASVRRLPPTAVARLLGLALPDAERGVDAAVPAPPFDAAALPYGALPDGWDVGDVSPDAGPIALDALLQLAGDPLDAPPAEESGRASRARRQEDSVAAIGQASAALLERGYVWWTDRRFWRLNGSAAWELVNEESVKADIRAALDAAGEEVRPDGGTWLGNQAAAEVLGRWSALATPASLGVLRESELAQAHNLDTGELVGGVPFADCTVSVGRDGSITTRPHDRREFRRWSLPYDWGGPIADAPPKFAAFLQRTFDGAPDAPARAALLCEAIGYTLSGDRGAQAVFVLVGTGGSGKGVILRLLRLLLGGDARVASAESPQRLAGRFFGSELVGKAALTLDDLPRPPDARAFNQHANHFAGLGIIKQLSGGDLLPVERKGGATVSMRLPVAVWGASNFALRWLQGAEDVGAWERRLWLLAFDNEVPEDERIPDYESVVLGDEHAAIASYCIGRYAAAVARGAGRGARFTRPDSSRSMLLAMLRGVVDAAAQFCESNVRRNPSAWLSRADLRRAMADALYDGVLERVAPNSNEWRAVIKWCDLQLGASVGKRNGAEGWWGLTLGGGDQAALDAGAPAVGGGGDGLKECGRCGARVPDSDLAFDGVGCARCAAGGAL